jgi:2-C-methyl-D-erythritol 4-phosphate cytidylyltransferase
MLRAVQTPQLFEAAALRQVHEASAREYTFATDDASLLERAGFAVASFPGDTHNLKITTPLHLQIAQLLLRTGAAA